MRCFWQKVKCCSFHGSEKEELRQDDTSSFFFATCLKGGWTTILFFCHKLLDRKVFFFLLLLFKKIEKSFGKQQKFETQAPLDQEILPKDRILLLFLSILCFFLSFLLLKVTKKKKTKLLERVFPWTAILLLCCFSLVLWLSLKGQKPEIPVACFSKIFC